MEAAKIGLFTCQNKGLWVASMLEKSAVGVIGAVHWASSSIGLRLEVPDRDRKWMMNPLHAHAHTQHFYASGLTCKQV